ncbi:MAG: TIGR03915 family putative DNA repair protein [Eubacteriaceae bacterium]|jgi:probable DNA metabolism protein|nr:TIGR03915 family putative DNA repair protein [Eubacteriaceae bacterium]
MTDYLYDGTFEGLLTCIYEHYYSGRADGIFRQDEYQRSLLCDCCVVETNPVKARKVYEAIECKISPFDLRRMYRAFRSCVEGRETMILKYAVLGFRVGSRISSLHGEQAVYDVQQAENKVATEIDKFRGIVRFSVLGDGEKKIYYAPVEPDNDMIEFIAEHFSNRFRDQAFVIHDLKRAKAVISARGEWYISDFEKEKLPPLDPDEEKFRELWRLYFDTIAIRERTNPKCQAHFLPKRYRNYLTEMNDTGR